MASVTETLHVSGVRCERCVMRLATALRDVDGIESANANLMGQVALAYDDQLTSRETIVGVLSQAGFPELTVV